MTTTEHHTGQLRYRSWAAIGRSLQGALDQVAALGVAWRDTRFEHYLQIIADHAILTREQILERPGTTLAAEALRQADQLTEASLLFPTLEKELLIEKLRAVVAGNDLHLAPDTDDRPRNTLFELMVGRILHEHGFAVQLTKNQEDLVATHPALGQRVSIECKRPAYCSTPEQVEKRLLKNLVGLRDQLKRRDRRNLRMGVVAMDGVYRMRDQTVIGNSHEEISAMVRKALEEAVAHIKIANRARPLHLETGMHVGAVVFLGFGQDANAAGYALRLTRAFLLGHHPEIRKALAHVFGVDLP